jgi:hypothetical protein
MSCAHLGETHYSQKEKEREQKTISIVSVLGSQVCPLVNLRWWCLCPTDHERANLPITSHAYGGAMIRSAQVIDKERKFQI